MGRFLIELFLHIGHLSPEVPIQKVDLAAVILGIQRHTAKGIFECFGGQFGNVKMQLFMREVIGGLLPGPDPGT